MFCGHSLVQHFEDWKTQKTSCIICCEEKNNWYNEIS